MPPRKSAITGFTRSLARELARITSASTMSCRAAEVMTERQVSLWLDEAGDSAMDENQCLRGRIIGADIAHMVLVSRRRHRSHDHRRRVRRRRRLVLTHEAASGWQRWRPTAACASPGLRARSALPSADARYAAAVSCFAIARISRGRS